MSRGEIKNGKSEERERWIERWKRKGKGKRRKRK